MSERFRCAHASRARGEPLYATASSVRRWVLVEQTGPWGRDAVAESRLPDRLASVLQARARDVGARVLLIRRPGRYSPRQRTCIVATTAPERRWVERLDLEDDTALLDLDFGPLGADEPLGGKPVDHPLYLVCTNGRHDACCAEFGRPLARALADRYGEQVWESSHYGGDRFAGNLVCLPHGLYFGRLSAVDGLRVAADYAAGVVDLAHYRGRSSYPFAVQAAEHFARERTGLLGVDDLRLRGVTAHGDEGVAVMFDSPAGSLRLVVDVTSAAVSDPLTCRAARAEAAPCYTLSAIEGPGVAARAAGRAGRRRHPQADR